jgi:hypothetical protein
MANNQLVEGLFQSLLAPQQSQGPAPQDIMAAISSQNPMAAAMALTMPQQAQVFGQGARGLLSSMNIGKGSMNAQDAMMEVMQKSDMTTSAGIQQAAAQAQVLGNRPLALQLTLQAQQLQMEEQQRLRDTARTQLQIGTSLGAIDEVLSTLDPEKDSAYFQQLTGFKNQVASGVVAPDKVQAGITSIANRNKRWDAWKQGQPEGAPASYGDFLQWKENLTKQDTAYDRWLRDNPGGKMADFWRAEATAKAEGRAAGTPGENGQAVPTPTVREQNMAQTYLNSAVRRNRFGFDIAAIPADAQESIANAVAIEAARLKSEKGGLISDHFEEATQALRSSGRISIGENGKVTLSPVSNPLSPISVEDFYR